MAKDSRGHGSEKRAAYDNALKRAHFVLKSPTMPSHVNAAGGVDAVAKAIKSKSLPAKLAALKRAKFLLESPTMPSFVNGGGAVDAVRSAIGPGPKRAGGRSAPKAKASAPKPSSVKAVAKKR